MAGKVGVERAHKDLDRALAAAYREGYAMGTIDGVDAERQRTVGILRNIGAHGVQYTLNIDAGTYEAEKTLDTEEIIDQINSEND